MVGSIGGTNNLIQMISFSYGQGGMSSQGMQGVGGPPPPPPPGNSSGAGEDPLGVFSMVDTDSDNTISESEYNTLTEGILEVTGQELSRNFLDYDRDGDGKLNGSELRSVLDEAGFAPPRQPPPPPPPPAPQVIAAYEEQSVEDYSYQTSEDSLLAQLMEYLETRSGDLDITA